MTMQTGLNCNSRRTATAAAAATIVEAGVDQRVEIERTARNRSVNLRPTTSPDVIPGVVINGTKLVDWDLERRLWHHATDLQAAGLGNHRPAMALSREVLFSHGAAERATGAVLAPGARRSRLSASRSSGGIVVGDKLLVAGVFRQRGDRVRKDVHGLALEFGSGDLTRRLATRMTSDASLGRPLARHTAVRAALADRAFARAL